MSIKEYVVAPLISEWVVDHSMALATGLFNIHRRRWHPEALAVVGVTEDRLSRPVSRPGLPPGGGVASAGRGLPDGVQVFLGGGDGPLANLGSGASAPGAVNVDLGTWRGSLHCHPSDRRRRRQPLVLLPAEDCGRSAASSPTLETHTSGRK